MDKLIIGVWQGVCRDGDVEANLARTVQVVDEAAAAGCDFVCLPEQFLAGYALPGLGERCAMTLDDRRLLSLAQHADTRSVVTLLGLIERRGDRFANTQVILEDGRVAGHYTKTMPTEGDWELMGFHDDELPVFDLRGLCFGIIICHDSSFPEVAATLAWKGARVIFSPHYNSLPRPRMDSHRKVVRNNHVGIAAHYGLVVARSNVVGTWPEKDLLGYGDSAIFGPDGEPIAEAGLFTETLITADVAPHLNAPRWAHRSELRPAVIEQLAQAAREALGKGRP